MGEIRPASDPNVAKHARILADVIERKLVLIEASWLARVQAEVDTRGIGLVQLRDGMPDYLAALVCVLRGDVDPHAGANAWAQVAREHGVTRVRIGFDISELIKEFITLRQVIQDVANEQGVPLGACDGLLADLLDAAITASVEAYVRARDYELRRRQAESIGFLTHELRNPLSNAIAAGHMLDRTKTPEQTRMFDVLHRSHQKLSDLVDGVLFSQKLAAGQMDPHPMELTLDALLEPALEAARVTATEKGVAFNIDFDRGARVRVDPTLTRSAVQNLADNAAKYTDRGLIDVTAEVNLDELLVHVRDTGPGIPPAELETIFEPFQRGAEERRATKKGTGLGLAIARKAAEAQGGWVGAEAGADGGAHFWLQLPRRVPDPE